MTTNSGPHIGERHAPEDAPHDHEIREQLGRIIRDAAFRHSLRLTRFLTFVVEETVAGQGNRLKAYTVAVEALGRKTDFDPQSDSIVRVEAGRLRGALARYYAGSGRNDPLVIDVPRGSYVPTFRWRDVQTATSPAAAPQRVDLKPQPERTAEIAGRNQQLGLQVAKFQALAEMHRERLVALTQAIQSARQTLNRSRELLRNTVHPEPAHRPFPSPPSQADGSTAAVSSGIPLAFDPDAHAAVFRMLDDLTAELLEFPDVKGVVEATLNAIIRLHRSDFGNVQLLDERTGELIIFAQRGFTEQFLQPFKRLSTAANGYISGRAARARAPVVVDDVLNDAEYAALRPAAAEAGYRAVQSTPLIATGGRLVGMVSTHFARPHTPSPHDMRMTELYARLAADFIAGLLPPGRDALANWADCAA
jgi:GAF domain-containing protein